MSQQEKDVGEISVQEAGQIIESLRKELGDKLSTMTGIVLDGTTAGEMRDHLKETIDLLWQESGFNQILTEPPELEFKYRTHPPAQIFASPKNESAKRVMQMLNLMHPTHRIKKEKANGEQA